MLKSGATTNSDAGVTDLAHVYPTLAAMEEVGLPLCVHGELTPASGVDVFAREPAFVETVLRPLLVRFPRLRVVLEHITTRQVCFCRDGEWLIVLAAAALCPA